jgi:hypothetical protein
VGTVQSPPSPSHCTTPLRIEIGFQKEVLGENYRHDRRDSRAREEGIQSSNGMTPATPGQDPEIKYQPPSPAFTSYTILARNPPLS